MLVQTAILYITVLTIAINLAITKSLIIGIIASVLYFLINGAFLGHAFFNKESSFLRLMLGILLITTVLGLVSWFAMIIYNLDVIPSVAIVIIAAILSTLLIFKKRENKQDLKVKSTDKQIFSLQFIVPTSIYLLLTALSFYLLLISRRGEASVVWWSVHPLFIPVFFLTTLILVVAMLLSQITGHKLGLIMVHSVLLHSLFVIIFPAGDLGGQQYGLGATRLIYDNIVLHGVRFPVQNILTQVYIWLRGDSFQAAISVILARMFNIDVFWTHLLLVPILWGIFIPLGVFMITRKLTKNNNIAALSALLIAVFPYTLLWGAMSVYNSLGFIFFLFSVYFFLEYLSSNQSRKWTFLMSMFVFLSFMAHFLTGIIALSFLLLVLTFKSFEDRSVSLASTKLTLLSALAFCTFLLPFAIVCRRFFYPEYSYFGLGKLVELSREDIFWRFLMGEYVNFNIQFAIIHILGPAIGILGMLYYIYFTRQKSDKKSLSCTIFLFTGLLLVLVDYRILKLLLINVPFTEERMWVFRDFLTVPFMAIIVTDAFSFLYRQFPTVDVPFSSQQIRRIALYLLIVIVLSGWITVSFYYAYPRYGPLQTTSYELEAVRFIEKNSTKPYVVIGDQWITFAGGMIVGIGNPNALYFHSRDPEGVRLFLEMRMNSSIETMKEAMAYNDATVAYFIIEKPRIGEEEYNRLIQQTEQNGLQTYPGGIFYYEGEEKLRIFYYKD